MNAQLALKSQIAGPSGILSQAFLILDVDHIGCVKGRPDTRGPAGDGNLCPGIIQLFTAGGHIDSHIRREVRCSESQCKNIAGIDRCGCDVIGILNTQGCLNQWNEGKQAEFKLRSLYKIEGQL